MPNKSDIFFCTFFNLLENKLFLKFITDIYPFLILSLNGTPFLSYNSTREVNRTDRLWAQTAACCAHNYC